MPAALFVNAFKIGVAQKADAAREAQLLPARFDTPVGLSVRSNVTHDDYVR